MFAGVLEPFVPLCAHMCMFMSPSSLSDWSKYDPVVPGRSGGYGSASLGVH